MSRSSCPGVLEGKEDFGYGKLFQHIATLIWVQFDIQWFDVSKYYFVHIIDFEMLAILANWNSVQEA